MAKQQEKKVVSKAPARKAAPAAKVATRAPIDWERIEPDFRAGIKSVLQIAADYEKATGRKISHTAINKHFKELGVTRDLKAKVKAKAEALVSAAMVSGSVSTETKPSDAVIINKGGEVLADVVLSQRKDIQRSRSLSMKLLDELEGQCDNPDVLNELRDIIIGPPIKGSEPADRAAERERQRLMDAFDRAMSLGSRIDSMKKLGETLKTLVGLERVAYGLADDGQNKGAGTLEDWLDSL